jgi:acyl-coenzyme A synthetase/AMP-(fatty) acid ligase
MPAAVSLGAIWSSSSPDFGIKGVLDRFGRIEPKVLFTAHEYFYNGKTFLQQLSVKSFEYAYREIKADMQLASISGGTDLNGCFALGNPMQPVHAGELQGPGLGLKVLAYNDAGKPVYDETDELVCAAAFPGMPVYFWNDPDGERYRNAYFAKFPGGWTHGDFISINSVTGGGLPSTAAATPLSTPAGCASAPPTSTPPWKRWKRWPTANR